MNAFTPQEIRDRIMKKDSEFQKKIISYLESVHVGEFQTGSYEKIKYNVDIAKVNRDYVDPIKTLPISSIKGCKQKCNKCEKCFANKKRWEDYFVTVDDILLKSNICSCSGKKIDDKDKNIYIKKLKIKGKKHKKKMMILYQVV